MKKNQKNKLTFKQMLIVLTVIYFKRHDDAGFFNFFDYLNAQVTLKGTADWGIAAGEVTALDAQFDIYKPLYDAIKIKNKRTPEQVEAHRAGRIAAENYIEDFANEFLINNSAINEETLNTLGFNRPSEERSERPFITETVFSGMNAQPGSRIEITCRTESDASRPSILPTADAVEVRYVAAAAGAVPPASWQDCPNAVISTKAKFTIELTPADAGKTIYAYARWRNNIEVQKSGPYGNRIETMVRG